MLVENWRISATVSARLDLCLLELPAEVILGFEPLQQVNNEAAISAEVGERTWAVPPKAVAISRYVFAYFTIHLVLLQFIPNGLHDYFSLYVSRGWLFSGYCLYGALIYLFAVYSMVLWENRHYVIGILQLASVLVLVGVMLYPFYSLGHIALLPFLAGMQPIILFSDDGSTGSFSDLERTFLRNCFLLIFLTPLLVGLMAFPIVEKIIIYCDAALVFARLRSVTRRIVAERRDYMVG